jgi:hypothetical protein
MTFTRRLLTLGVLVTAGALPVAAQEPKPLSTEQVEKLHRMFRPQPGESRWMEIDWHPSVWEARQIAAREGKPIFLLAGSGGAPPAGC